MINDIKSMSFEDLMKQWTPLIEKFSSWNVRNMDRDDVRQEMLLSLWNAQRTWDFNKASFKTYFYKLCTNRLIYLEHIYNNRQCRNPLGELISLDFTDEGFSDNYLKDFADTSNELENAEIYTDIYSASNEAKIIALDILGDLSPKDWGERFDLTQQEIEKGITELKNILEGE